MAQAASRYNNCAIARACGVTETTVRKWLAKAEIRRDVEFNQHTGRIDEATILETRTRAEQLFSHSASRSDRRFTPERVGEVITMIGEQAGIVVREADEETGHRLKYASAHDLRRGCALRLINAGVSAETLKVVLRHRDFRTTERFYGATRSAQSAAAEIHQKLTSDRDKVDLAGGRDEASKLSAEELRKLKALLNAL